MKNIDIWQWKFSEYRFQQGGEALLILTAREEQGMIKQLEDKKVPIKKIE